LDEPAGFALAGDYMVLSLRANSKGMLDREEHDEQMA
jgi:hypothetical protein